MSNTVSSTIKTHTFEHINDVPFKIKPFYVENEQGQVQLIAKTETCSLERLQLFIERGNTAHIEAAAGRVANGQKWQYFDEYHNYLTKLIAINDYNANLPIIGKDEHDIDIYASPKTIPDEPEAMPEYTGSKVLAPYLVNLFKADRQDKMQRAKVIINSGKTFDADEKSITRLNNAINAARNEISDFIIEWSTADVDTGVMVPCTKAELEEAHTKAVQNMGFVWKVL